MKQTVMVTGSQGYIGSNLCRWLIYHGHNVIQIDKTIGSDILETFLHDYNPDVIVHLAAIASIGDCEIDKHQTIRDNVLTCQYISQFAFERQIPVFFSSSQAVKNPSSSTYAMTKLIGEEVFKDRNEFIIMRFANVFGGINFIDDKTSVVAKWIRRYQRGEPVTINGDGHQTRDFVHVDDLCKIIIMLLSHKDAMYNTFDVGTGVETSINELFEMFPKDAKYEYHHYSDMVGVASNVADTSGLIGLDIETTITVSEYLKDLLSR